VDRQPLDPRQATRRRREHSNARPEEPWAAEFVQGRLQERTEGDSRHEQWQEEMKIIQTTRRRKMERCHLVR
jgi:hypothetical protein